MALGKDKVKSPPIVLTKREMEACKRLATTEGRSFSNWAARVLRQKLEQELGSAWCAAHVEFIEKSH